MASPKLSWEQALGWRMGRQLLDPIGSESVPGVVRRLCGVQAQVASSAEMAVRVRRQRSRAGEVQRALADGQLIKTWAMRGALHLLTPQDGPAFLALIAAARTWERPSWQRYFGVTPETMELLRGAVREALGNSTLTREELVAALSRRRDVGNLADGLRSSWGTLFKPLAWQGDIVLGASRGGRTTFVRPEVASARWSRLPSPDEAAPTVIAAYLRAYGPAPVDNFSNWMSGGWFGKRQLRAWFAALGDRVTTVQVDGEEALVLREDLDELMTSRGSGSVRLLPGFDQYVLGPGTADGHVLPARRRAAVSRQAGWIAPVVVVGGVVRGTWTLEADELRIEWFREAGAVPRAALAEEVTRLGETLGRDLRVSTTRI